jgi:tetratricopeptide (TPR) repeat protein
LASTTYFLEWQLFEADSAALDQAEALANRVAAFGESNDDLQLLLSRIALRRGRYDAAFAHNKRALKLNPNNADLIYHYGELLLFDGRSEESIPWFEKAIRRNPSPPIWYLFGLCNAYIGSGLYHEAIATGKKLVANYPDQHGAYFNLGVSNFGMGSYAEAIAAFKKAINIAPTYTLNLELCAVTQSMAGNHKEAIEMEKKAIDFGRQESPYVQIRRFSHLAEYYRRLGWYDKAIDTSRRLLDSNPDTKHALRAYITLTCAYSALGNEEDARAAAAEVLRISPNFSLESEAKKDSWIGLSHYDWFMKHEPDKNLLVTAPRTAGLK